MGRASDKEPGNYYPTDRYFVANGLWYFATREKIDFGPYTRHGDAIRALRRYLDTQATMRRIRGGDTVLTPDNTFNEQGVAEIAKQIRTWSDRSVGDIRGDEQRLGSMLGDDELGD